MFEIDWASKVMEKYGNKIKHLEYGKTLFVKCPVCKCKMHIWKSQFNGHLRMGCDSCDIMMIQ